MAHGQCRSRGCLVHFYLFALLYTPVNFDNEHHNLSEGLGIRVGMKKIGFGILALMFFAPLVPAASAQVVVEVGHAHHHHYHHCWYSHHHRHCN